MQTDKAKTDAIYFYKQADRITILAWKDGKFALANRYPADNLDEVFLLHLVGSRAIRVATCRNILRSYLYKRAA